MPWAPLPTPDRGASDTTAPQPLASVLDRVLGGLGGASVDAVVLVYERWADVVGEEVAPRTRPLSIEGDLLRVGADDAAWASHLRWAEKEVLDRLEALLGSRQITRLVVRVAPSR